MSMEERLLAKASELIDQRVAQIMEAPSAPRVRRLDNFIYVDPDKARQVDPQNTTWNYAGQLQLTDNEVFVVPFVVESYYESDQDGILIAPKIGGRSIFSENRPSLNRLNSGGAVFLEKKWTLSVVPLVYFDPETDPFQIKAEFVDCQIIQQEVGLPFPKDPGEVSWPYLAIEISEVSVTKSQCRSFSLIGAYTKDGNTFPGGSTRNLRVSSFTDISKAVLVASDTNPPFIREVSLPSWLTP